MDQSVAHSSKSSELAHYDYIDLIRCIAILLVIFVHTGLSFRGAIRPIADFGRYGVQLFFVASAYTLCMSWMSRRDAYPVLSFYIRRFFRIAPLYYLAMIGYGLFPDRNVSFTAKRIALNVTFVHQLVDTSTGIVPGSWSISNEMMFYVIFPPLVMLLAFNARLFYALAAIYCLGFLAAMNGLGGEWLRQHSRFPAFHLVNAMPIFFCGFAAWHISERFKLRAWWLALATLAFFGLLLALPHLTRPVIDYDYYGDPIRRYQVWNPLWITGPLFASLLLFTQHLKKIPRLLVDMGRCSFSMYIIHFMFLRMIKPPVVNHLQSWPPVLVWALCFLSITGATYALAKLTYRYIELPGIALGKRLIYKMRRLATERTPALPQPASELREV